MYWNWKAQHVVQPGLYVLGLINQSPASRAGIAQGDQLLEVDGVSITNESPFQAATLIQGPEDGPRTPKVSVKVDHLSNFGSKAWFLSYSNHELPLSTNQASPESLGVNLL